MRYAAGFPLLVALLSFAPCVNGQRIADFSGTWKMDPARSESAHQTATVESSTLMISPTDTGFTIETTRSEGGNPSAFHETLNLRLDGSETTTTGADGAKVTGKAYWDGPSLVIETVRAINDSTVSTLHVHTLNARPSEMTVGMTLTVQHGYQGMSSGTGRGKDVFVRVTR